MALKRITRELEEMRRTFPHQFSVEPVEGNLFHLKVTITGPEQTPYEGGEFDLTIRFPEEYPFRSPRIAFTSKIFHPNVDSEGNIGVAILNRKWSPGYTTSKILLMIYSLFYEPDLSLPLMPEIATLYEKDPEQFKNTAAEWTAKYTTKR
eukprot:scpid37655/ scgid8299/ Ubiquitin-conjugating enzyme E2 D4; HBUCE1; Ubiquitin carrier protein D4; Ubiquitin-protein ligase D4